MFDLIGFAKDDDGATAIEYGGIMSASFFAIYIPLSYVFGDMKEAIEFLVNALSVT